ncbi:ribbon-helix-helix protein, CopG family [Leptospira noguchii]|uniref:Ribbon-helix-helix protein, CopG family n=1 Tax=Leptospira noguchii TaxID=28182 RepID=A0A9Q8VXS0_9LEPT|nr:ribbon-helix-helix protein, CopG family [Leptospira noguchii]TQE81679.1 ribbon-helix-helix protein, CopG family [Leptospira noguchii]UOG32300.1 ribbon-helix-helix protein, CopG family [Leptospira noguchii]UOG35912.1 ribbon-helix-helix protein, CopG family [Leptospira noguchii]UOG39577.1 ribbon-helix-helix protein, CopG family [Leptospira noguchii]UOG46851.1 ribbon-helix-helix protein, CopG family [Leptospira noguchii]
MAKREHRSRSELIREAARTYIEKKNRWQTIFDFTSKAIGQSDISEKDVFNKIKSVRTRRNAC